MRNVLLLLLSFTVLVPLHAQEFDVSFHGYVGVNTTFDSRANVAARNRHVFLYPLPENLSEQGEDLNARSQFDIDAAHSRFGLNIGGPQLAGFNTSAMLEGDFVGNGEIDSYFRLRHAFVTFSKKSWSLLAGQTWHPMFLTENFPGTVNVNAGTPFHPLIRNPQLRLTWNASDNTQLLFFLIDQNNFRSSGFGSNSSEEALMPEVDAQLKWKNRGIWTALTGGYKTLAIPETQEPLESPEKVSAWHFKGSFKYTLPAFTFKMEGIYGTNLSEMVMLGGTGRSLSNGNYVSLGTSSLWTDIHTNHTEGWQPGVFAGYTANLGAHEEVTVAENLSRSGGNIKSVYAISPRLKYIMGKAWVGLEYLFTNAAWGNEFDGYGVPINTEDYVNHRLLLSLQYNF